MAGGGKGGSQTQTTEVKIPQWLQQAAKANIARADDIAALGYVPYFGPDVAALTPMQEAAFANTGAAAGAFGLPGGGMTGTEGLPAAQDFGGVRAYSSAPLYQQSLDALQQNAPGQAEYLAGMFIDPVTGEPGRLFGNGALTQAVPQAAQQALTINPYTGLPMSYYPSKVQAGINGLMMGPGNEAMSNQGATGYSGTGGGNLGFGGYTSVGDMFNGGGPGASGNTFQGGGVYSGVANMVANPVGSSA